MSKNLVWIVLAAFICCAGTACKKKPDQAAQKAQAEAKWREEQRQKAAKYYGDLVKNYPDSEYAKQAQERLSALGPVATPAAKK